MMGNYSVVKNGVSICFTSLVTFKNNYTRRKRSVSKPFIKCVKENEFMETEWRIVAAYEWIGWQGWTTAAYFCRLLF